MASYMEHKTNLLAANYYFVISNCDMCNFNQYDCICCGLICKYCELDFEVCNCDCCQDCGALSVMNCNCKETICQRCHKDIKYNCRCFCRDCDHLVGKCKCRHNHVRYDMNDPIIVGWINDAWGYRMYQADIARHKLKNSGYYY